MQAINTDISLEIPSTENRVWAWVRFETIAYMALVLLAVVLRVAMLDASPMGDVEASQAMTAWHVVYPDAVGEKIEPSSPMTVWTQVIGFTMVNKGEFGARIGTVIGGVLLVLLPLFFRAHLGMVRTFILSLLYAFSPITLAASRSSDAMIWTALFALLLLSSLWHYWQTRQRHDAVWVGVYAGGLLFLSGSGGVVTAGILIVAGVATVWWTALNAPLEMDTPSEEVIQFARSTVREFPYWVAGLTMGFVVFLVTTGMMLYPAGLGMIGQSIGNAITGIWQPYVANVPPAFPLLIMVVYDVLLVIFALIAYILLSRQHMADVSDRLAMCIVIVSAFVLLFYRGASPAYALLLAMPMGWIVAHAVSELLIDREVLTYWDLVSDEHRSVTAQYGWVKWVLGLILVGILVMLGVHLQEVGRTLLTFPIGQNLAGYLPRLLEPALAPGLRSFVWLIISVLFTIVGCFLVASIWGNYVTLQSLGIGFFVFMLVSGFGGGWNAVVTRASEPQEIWQSTSVVPDAYLLRATLLEVAQRDSRIFPLMPVTVVENPQIGLTNNGIMPWILRDFPKARFTPSLEDAQRDQIVIMSETKDSIDLGGSYVGQSFALRNHWSLADMVGLDWVSWLSQRSIRTADLVTDSVILWLRLDVYNGSPLEDQQP